MLRRARLLVGRGPLLVIVLRTVVVVAVAVRAGPLAAPAADDTIAQLQKLAELQKAGILTEEEFAAKKKQLLGI